jgi:metal-dependent amidase/aminoacylase/carboxypeptidase family protein
MSGIDEILAAERLSGDGFTVQEGIGGTGVTGVLANGSGPTVLLRCAAALAWLAPQ